MPRPKRQVRAADEDMLEEVRERRRHCTEYYRSLEAAACDFQGWCAENTLLISELLPGEVRSLYHRSRDNGVGPRTTMADLEVITKFNFHKDHMAEVLDRIHLLQYKSAVSTVAENAPFARNKTYPSTGRMADLCLNPPASVGERHLRTLWFFCIVTGNRPCNLFHARFEIEEEHLVVHWGKRKHRRKGRSGINYPWHWCGLKPLPYMHTVVEEITARLLRHPPRPDGLYSGWAICRGQTFPTGHYDVGSRICTWLKRWNVPWTSTTPRDVMSTMLLGRLGEAEVEDEKVFKQLLDHSVTTSRLHYARRPGQQVDEMGVLIHA